MNPLARPGRQGKGLWEVKIKFKIALHHSLLQHQKEDGPNSCKPELLPLEGGLVLVQKLTYLPPLVGGVRVTRCVGLAVHIGVPTMKVHI